MCIGKLGRWPLENHPLSCESSLKRGQQPFAISQPSVLFFLAVLLCFLLDQTSCEHTEMGVFVPSESHSVRHGLIVLTQTNVLLLVLHPLGLRQRVSCGILCLMLHQTITVSCVPALASTKDPRSYPNLLELMETISLPSVNYIIQKGFGLSCQDRILNNFFHWFLNLSKLAWN